MIKIIALAILVTGLMLSGFSAPPLDYFPAPLAEPMLAFYANFAASGLYESGETALGAHQEIVSQIQDLCITRGADKTKVEQIRAAAQNLLDDQVLSGRVKASEIFVYYTDPQNFVLIMRGEFDRQKLASLIGKDKVSLRQKYLVSRFTSPLVEQAEVYLQIADDELLLCPDNISGNLASRLEAQSNLLGSEFAAFAKMVRVRPAIAAEINLNRVNEAETEVFPEWLRPLRYARLVISSRLSKLQLFVPEDEARELMLRQVEAMVGGLRQFAANLVDFTAQISGNSVFVEAEAGEELERLFARRAVSFLAHFFVRAQKLPLVAASLDSEAVTIANACNQ